MDPVGGGVATAVDLTTRALLEKGFEVEVACSDAPDAPFLKNASYPVHALGPGKYHWAYSEKWLPWLEANLERFDRVLIEGLWLYPSHIAALACRRAGQPYCVFPHGMLDPWFQRLSERPLKAVRNLAYWLLVESHVVNNAAMLLFTCEQERRLARIPFTPYRPEAEFVTGLGTTTPPEFTPQMQAVFSELVPTVKWRRYWLFLGRLHPKKGVDILLDAFAQMAKEGFRVPDLVVAGPGLDTSYGKACIRKAAAINRRHEETSNGRVLFTGMLTGDEKWGAIYGCVTFILPSHQENFGITVAEALACSRPVLVSNQVNIFQEIQRGGGGLAGTDDFHGTCDVLHRWLTMPEADREAMSGNARETFQRHFDITRAASKIAEAMTLVEPTPTAVQRPAPLVAVS
ncbi:MAG: glycosyltransferase [Opitutales bacterium]